MDEENFLLTFTQHFSVFTFVEQVQMYHAKE